jgi:hypothetical protein
VRDQWWLCRKTHPAELGAAVTTLGRSRELLDVVIAEDAAGGLDNAPSRRRGVIRLALAEGDTLGHCFRVVRGKIWVAMRLTGGNETEPGGRDGSSSSLQSLSPCTRNPRENPSLPYHLDTSNATHIPLPRPMNRVRPHTLQVQKS